VWAYLGGDRLQPFVRVAEHRINVKDDATKRMHTVLDHLTDLELRLPHFVHQAPRYHKP
jgi:hypothetical protein